MWQTKKKLLVFGSVGLVACALVALWAFPILTDPERKAGKAKVQQVKVVRPKKGGMERLTTASGTLHSFQHVEVFPKVSGFLINQRVDIGDEVKMRGLTPWLAGASAVAFFGAPGGSGRLLVPVSIMHSKTKDILAEIEAPELYQEEYQALANLEKAKAQVQQMEAQLVATTEEIAYKKAESNRAKANLDFRQKRYNRYAALSKAEKGEKPIIPQDFLDEEFDKLETAKAWRDSATAGVAFAEAKVVQARADLAAAKANQKASEAAVEKTRVFVEFTKIRSYFNGRITKRNFHNGDYIRSPDKGGTVPLYVIQRTDKMRLIVQVPDCDVPFVDKGDPVDLRIRGVSDDVLEKLRLKISRYSFSQDERSRAMRVEIDIANKNDLLRDGMYGEVVIHLEKGAADAFTVPSHCLRNRSQDRCLLYVVREGKTRVVEARVGQENGEWAEILPSKQGLRNTDFVMLDHGGPLQEGLRVAPVEVKDVAYGSSASH